MTNFNDLDLYFLSGYNNYFNRMHKNDGADVLADAYADHWLPTMPLRSIKNFNPGDGVDTLHVLSVRPGEFDGNCPEPDYLVITNGGDSMIRQRWFVVETQRTRNNQWICKLHRDVVAENLEAILKAPAYVEKGWLKNVNDPAIYLPEDLEVNQVKKGQYSLKDRTGIPWIIGYMDKAIDAGNITFTPENKRNIVVNDISEFWSEYPQGQHFSPTASVEFQTYGKKGQLVYVLRIYSIDDYTEEMLGGGNGTLFLQNINVQNYAKNYDSWKSLSLGGNYANQLTEEREVELLQLNGKIVYSSSDSKTYQVSISQGNGYKEVKIGTGSSLYNKMKQDAINSGAQSQGDSQDTFRIYINGPTLELSLIEVSPAGELTIQIPAERTYCSDAAYDLFALPYVDGVLTLKKNGLGFANSMGRLSKLTSLECAVQIAKERSQAIYDIQIVPFCPFSENLVSGNGSMLSIENLYEDDIDGIALKEGKDYTFIKDKNDVKGVIFFPDRSTFSFSQPFVDELKKTYLTVKGKKLANQSLFYRFSSPNYASAFDFYPAKNNGVTTWTASCTYKPGIPYIRVAPQFSGLYGSTFPDNRGLILNGDFSISRVNSQFMDYVQQNKNFELSFNREIENMGVVQAEELRLKRFNAVAGVVVGGAVGATTGASMAGPVGSAAGAILGTGAAAIGGVMDVQATKRLNEEALDYRKDMFNYSIQSMKARANTLSRVTGYNIDNQYFPFVEVYDCTDVEKAAIESKLQYNGMSVYRIGTFESYKRTSERTYLKGKIIRMEGIEADAHYVAAISNEMDKGVYI